MMKINVKTIGFLSGWWTMAGLGCIALNHYVAGIVLTIIGIGFMFLDRIEVRREK